MSSLNKPLISLNLMLKNEQSMIEKTIQSIMPLKNLVDLQIVIGIDRKSKDKTKQIVSKYADVLFDFDFNDNFSEIRNEVINRSSGEWILISDGHEIWRNIENIPNVLLKIPSKVEAIAFLLEMCPEEGGTIGQQIRLFKNDINRIFYEGKVHNKLNIDSSSSLATDDVTIYHVRDKDKRSERYGQRKEMLTRIMEEDLKNNPDDARANYYLGVYYLSEAMTKDGAGEILKESELDKSKIKKAIPLLEHYIRISEFDEEIYLARWYLAQAYYHLGWVDKAKFVAYEMFEQKHEFPLAQGVLCDIYLKQYKDAEKKDKRLLYLAEHWIKLARAKKMPLVSCFFPKAHFTYLAWDRLVEIYSIAGHLVDALISSDQLLTYEDYPIEKRKTLMKCRKVWEQTFKDLNKVFYDDWKQGNIDIEKQLSKERDRIIKNLQVQNENIDKRWTGHRKLSNVNTVDISNVEKV